MNLENDASGTVLAPVEDMATLAFDGPDAAGFLHGQLSTEVETMPIGSATWSSYNSPKGRMLASLLLWRESQHRFVAFVAADIAQSLRKRLAMFVLRAKVSIDDAGAGRVLFGLAGPGASEAAERARARNAVVIALPDGRFLLAVNQADVRDTPAALRVSAVPNSHWNWLNIRAGIAIITHATQDLFVPQTANLDLVGGIHFRKGCYPGQEIVARMQYLGKLKERLFAFHVDAGPPAPGTSIYAINDAAASGTVVNAAPAPSGGSDLLAVTRFDAILDKDLRLGAATGPSLTRVELPYAIPAPVAPNRVKL